MLLFVTHADEKVKVTMSFQGASISYTLHTKAYMLHCIVWEAHNNNDLCPCKCEGQTTVIHRNDNRKLSTEREQDITRGAVETFGGRTLDLLCIMRRF